MNFNKIANKLELMSYLKDFDIDSSPDGNFYYITCKNYNDDYLQIEVMIDIIGKNIEYSLLDTANVADHKLLIDTAQIEDLKRFINILLEEN